MHLDVAEGSCGKGDAQKHLTEKKLRRSDCPVPTEMPAGGGPSDTTAILLSFPFRSPAFLSLAPPTTSKHRRRLRGDSDHQARADPDPTQADP